MYQLIKAIPMSFFSRSFYQNVSKTWRARGFLYLLLLLALLWVVMAGLFTRGVFHSVQYFEQNIVTQLPPLTFQSGVLSISSKNPVDIQAEGKTIMMIDARNQITLQQFMKNDEWIVLMQDTTTYFKGAQGAIRQYQYPTKFSGTYTAPEIQAKIQKNKTWVLLATFALIYVMGLAILYAIKLVFSLLYSLAGLLFSFVAKKHLPYLAILNIVFLACTPATLLHFVFFLLHIYFPFQGILLIAITLGYLWFGIKSADPVKTD